MRLIDAEAFLKMEIDRCGSAPLVGTRTSDNEYLSERLKKAPTIEVKPVVHRRWIDKGEYAVCTECGGRSGTQYDGVEPIPLMTQFCPNCGAQMDEKENDK